MKKIFIIFGILLLSSYVLFSDIKIDKIAVINLDEVLTTVFSGKSSVVQEIKNEKKELQDKLDKIKENIVKLEELRLKETDTAKKLVYEKKIDELKQEYSEYYKVRSYQIQKKIDNVQTPLLQEIYQVVKRVAESEGYTMVLNNENKDIFYYSVDVNITEKVIDFFNKKE